MAHLELVFPAELPGSPSGAAIRKSPNRFEFGLHGQANRYPDRWELFRERAALPRDARGEVLIRTVARYARHRKDYCGRLPEVCFNHLDFWEKGKS